MKYIKKYNLPIIMFLLVVLLGSIEIFLSPRYLLKSLIKIILFFVIPFLMISKEEIRNFFKINKNGILKSFILAIVIYICILLGYFLLNDIINFSNITNSLTRGLNINKNNFIYVVIYISFINSLLEEFFFRGIGFLTLKKKINTKFAFIFSSLLFSIYHISIINSWFNPFIVILMLIGLFVSGAIFNYLDSKNNNLYNSWLVHMFANFSINTIGLILFGII